MKFILLLLLLSIFSLDIHAQYRAEEEIKRIDLKLDKFRSQHQTGTLLSILGAAIVSIPFIAELDEDATAGLTILGSATAFSGFYLSMDSYKYLKLESKRKLGSNGIK